MTMKINKFLKGRSGIYGIRNTNNNKIYIGKTKCMYRRCSQYIYDFKNRALGHINDYLYNAMKKDGIDNFEFFPLQFVDISDLDTFELAWMVQLKSTDNKFGYNLRMDSSTGMITSPSTSEKISNNLKKQWSEGVRDGHSNKLKKSWANDPDRKLAQSILLTSLKTKFTYKVHHENGVVETCNYSRLVELGLKNVIANFHRKKSNDVMCKGFRVIRSVKGDQL